MPRSEIVAIGASAGGFDALRTLISHLPSSFEIPIAIVLHRSKESEALASLLQDCTPLRVLEVEDKQPLEPATIYLAPPDYHMLLDEGSFALSTDEPVRYSRPSIDVFFLSVADMYGPGAIGVVLTGANADGSAGLKRIVLHGGQAMVQDPDTAEMPEMPASAQREVAQARVLTLEEIAAELSARDRLQRPSGSSRSP